MRKYMIKKSRRHSRKFRYSHDMGPALYNASQTNGGILLVDNAFNWMGNTTALALMS